MFACFFVCVVRSIILGSELRAKVNRCRPEEEPFHDRQPESRIHLIREYRRRYPGDRLLRSIFMLNTIMLGCLVVAMWVFGTFK